MRVSPSYGQMFFFRMDQMAIKTLLLCQEGPLLLLIFFDLWIANIDSEKSNADVPLIDTSPRSLLKGTTQPEFLAINL